MSKKFLLILILGLCSYGNLGQGAQAQSIQSLDAAVNQCVREEKNEKLKADWCHGSHFGKTRAFCEVDLAQWTEKEKKQACRTKHSRH